MKTETGKKNAIRYILGGAAFLAAFLLTTFLCAAILVKLPHFERFYPAVSWAVFVPCGAVTALFARRERKKAPADAAVLSLIAVALLWVASLAVSGGAFRPAVLGAKSALLAGTVFLSSLIFTRRKARSRRGKNKFRFG